MNEELLIKVKVDTSSVTSSINKLKNEVSNVNASMNSTSSASAKTAKSTNNTAKATNKVKEALEKVSTQINNIKGMNLLDFAATVSGLKVVEKALDRIKRNAIKGEGNDAKEQFGYFSNMFSSFNPFSKDVEWEGLNAALENFKLSFQGFSESVLGKAFKTPKSLKELKASMGDIGKLAKAGFSNGLKAAGAALGSLATAASLAFAALSALVVVMGVVASFTVSKLGNEIYNTANRFNMGTEAFQEWSYVMERSGGTIDDLTGFMETLASEQAAVIEGSEDAAANFKRLGLSMQEVSGMRQQELFEETVRRIQSIEDATERSAIAYSIFGDEASKFMNVLNMSNGEMSKLINNYHLLGGAMGDDLLKKSNMLQGAISNLKQAWKGVSNTLAEVFIPAVYAVVHLLTKALVIINLFLRSIFGLELRTTGTSKGLSGAANATKSYTNATKAATKAAEELKRTTMGFDELNIVQDPNKSSGSSGAGAGAATPDMSGIGAGLDSSLLNTADLNLEGIYAWFDKYKTIIRDVVVVTSTFLGLLLIIFGGLSLNLPMVIGGAVMAGIGFSLGLGEGGTWDRFLVGLKAIGKWLLDGIAHILTVIADAGTWVIDKILELDKKLGDWIKSIIDWFIDSLVSFASWIATWVKAAVDTIVKAVVNFPNWIYTRVILPVAEWFAEMWTKVKNFAVDSWNGIKNAFATAADWFNTRIVQPVGKFFSNMWSGFKSGAKSAWEGIKSVFSVVTTWFKDKFTAAWTAVKNIFSTGGKIFDGIKEGIASTFKTVVNGLIGGINKVIAVPFNAINNLLNKIRSVSVAGIEPFKNIIKYNALSVPQIPKLATGGIITSESLFVGGEGGKKEAVLPLEQNTGWMDALADRIAARNSSPSKIVLQIGEKEFAWAAINGINNITKQTGGIQLAL